MIRVNEESNGLNFNNLKNSADDSSIVEQKNKEAKEIQKGNAWHSRRASTESIAFKSENIFNLKRKPSKRSTRILIAEDSSLESGKRLGR